jgi:hypothetical protein
MKNIFPAIISSSIAICIWMTILFTSSCEDAMGDFLDKAPGVDVTEDTIFSSRAQLETFVASMYQYGIHSNLGYYSADPDDITNNSGTIPAGATDEAETCAAWYDTQKYNNATLSADNTNDHRFPFRWTAIRKITVLIDRVHDVPDIDDKYAKQLIAEAKFLRALNYFEMLKRYGGVPIIDHRIQLTEELKIPRSSVEEVVNFILQDCREALPDLPAIQLGALRGRASQGTVLAVKAKTLLYAASPLFNTATPYLDFGANNPLICYGDYKASRWQDAADAAKEVLDWAAANGCRLIEDKGVAENYRYSWEMYDNEEIILAEKAHGSRGRWTWPWSAIAPPSLYPGNAGQSGVTPMLNFVKKYEKKNGTPQIWNPAGGSNLQALMAELDPRFAQTIAGNGSIWNTEKGKMEIYEGGRDNPTCFGGFWLHKLYPSMLNDNQWSYVPNSTLFQLNEFYLSYAEALNEANNGPAAEAYAAVNRIRTRSGMPDLPANLNYKEFQKRIRNERDIEMAFDNHRLWDIRRWMIAEEDGVMKGEMIGIKVAKIAGNPNECSYTPYVFETRSFVRRMYLEPFPTKEINKGYLFQNPGY